MPSRGPDPKVTDNEVLQIIRDLNRPFATPPCVARQASLSETRSRERLAALANAGRLKRYKTGSTWVYWLGSD